MENLELKNTKFKNQNNKKKSFNKIDLKSNKLLIKQDSNIYHELPILKIIPLKNQTLLANISGPDENETELQFNFKVKGLNQEFLINVASCQSTSTYPFLPEFNIRYGDPICDTFCIKIYENRAIMALADGCNWGNRPKEAAWKASQAFINYVDSNQNNIHDVRDVGHYLLRGFDKASREIIVNKEDPFDAGTTTLLGGMLLELEKQLNKDNEEIKSLCFVCVNVGDCKAFHWSPTTNQVIDITDGNRNNLTNASDPGGRLGPCTETGAPDLRNLKLYYIRCQPGDIIFLISDGIHDNCDPQMLGKKPKDLDISSNSWEEAEKKYPKKTQTAKTNFRQKLLKDLLQDIIKDYNEIKPTYLTKKLMQYCFNITESSRKWMLENPKEKLPLNFEAYPGKMDHSTCICLKIGIWNETNTIY